MVGDSKHVVVLTPIHDSRDLAHAQSAFMVFNVSKAVSIIDKISMVEHC